jgi:PadR family transcriptional regulator AphA
MDTKRPRKVYLITEAGKAALRDWLSLPPEQETCRVEILLKLYFANLVPFESINHHLSAFREEHQKDLQTLKHIETELRGITDMHDNHPFILMTVLLGLKLNAAYVEWADGATVMLDDLYKARKTL